MTAPDAVANAVPVQVDDAEARRLAALRGYGILDTPPTSGFDDLAALAAQLCAAPVGLITFVDDRRQFFKARAGDEGGTDAPLDAGFCPYVVRAKQPVIIPDTTAEPEHAANPATRAGGVRFYAGVPLLTEDGHVLGTLCVLDHTPRPSGLAPAELNALQALARQAMTQLAEHCGARARDAALAEREAVLRLQEALIATQAKVAAFGDLEAVLDAVVAGAMAALPQSEGGVIELVSGDDLEYVAVRGSLVPHRGLTVPLRASVAGYCWRMREPVRVPDVLADPRVKQDLVERLALRSCVLAPVERNGVIAGVLKLQSSRPDAFSERDLRTARAFAGLATAGLAGIGEAQARRAERESETRYRAIFDSSVDIAIIATDSEGRVTDWNSGAARILGWSAEEVQGDTIERIFTPEDRRAGRAAAEMRLSLRDGRASDERWHLRKDGTRFYASGEMMPLRDADALHIGFVKVMRDRTEEHRAGVALREAEGRLRESEDHFRHTVETNPQVPWTCDPQGNITSYSNRWLELTGQAPGEPLGAGWAKALHPDDLPHTLDVFGASLASGAPVDVDYRIHVPAADEYRWMRARAYPRRDQAGAVIRWYGVVEDIHDRKLAEDRLRSSEERYRTLFNAIDEGFCIIAFIDGPHGPLSDYVHVEANPGYQRHTGIPDIVGKRLREIVAEEADGWAELYGSVLRTGVPVHFERAFVAVGRHIEVSASRIEPASRRQVAVLFRDITERKQGEAALRESEAQFRAFAQAVPNQVWASRPDGYLYWFNAQAYAYAGTEPGTLYGVTEWGRLLHPHDLDRAAEAWSRSLSTGDVYEIEFRIRRHDGAYRWFLVRAEPVRSLDGAILRWVGTNTDIDERRRQSEELAALNATLEQRVAARTEELMLAEAALRQSQKMEAVGQLTGGLAHDFNNMLAGITGSLELMQSRFAQGRLSELDRYMTAAQGAAKRAAALTHRLLAFSRRQTLAPKPTDVNRLVADMEDLIRRTAGPAVHVEVVGASGLWPTLVDPPQLENALLNLCINARDAMPDGGRIVIETGNRWLDARAARERDLEPGQYLSLCVSDNGTGMSPDVIARAFDPFFTTKPTGEGTGLGLSMIYGFAKQSGGQVRIYSELGQGTMVCLYLPRHYGEATGPEAAPAPSTTARAETGETVLVVDDEPTVRMLVTEVLEDLGYAAIEAADSVSGLKVLHSDVRIDLLVTDVGLPGGMNGRQMVDAASVSRPGLRVLFITGYAENAALNHGHLAPGMQVLTKPFSLDALASRIRAMIEAER